MAPQFDLQVLGSPMLRDRRGAPVGFRTQKQLALLTYLHFEGRERPLSRDRLAGLLWPGASPEKGRHSLSQALLAIRSRLGVHALTQRKRDVRLLVELASDLDALQNGDVSLPSVLEPLMGIEDSAGAEFAHWVDGARARIRGQARESLRAALRKARFSGDLRATHRLAMLLYGIDPLCAEAVYALAERALLESDVVMAVRLLKEQMHRAQAELGANPNPELAQLLRRLERGERPAFLAPASALPAAFTRREVFVGREAELSQLEAIWERTRSAGYQTCLITGAPGIGKSSLLRRFATSLGARAWPGFVVPCQEIGKGIPYAAVSELITAMGRDPSAGGTDPHWLAEASRVSPGLRGIYPGIPEPPNAPTDSIRLRVAEAVLRIMDVVSDSGPMLVAFDDVHHMDPASRDVLFLVTRRMENVPTLIVATSRLDGSEVAAAESERGTLGWGERIVLLPLDQAQATCLVDDLLEAGKSVDTRIRDTIIWLAQGNPYFVEMLLSDWKQHEAHSLVAAETDGDRTVASWSPPETLRSAFERHYRELSVEAKHLLQLLAVAERALATPEIAFLLALDARAAERLVLEMLDQVGRVEAGRVVFKNELQRAYVYYAMSQERRIYFHARVAKWLSEKPNADEFQSLLEASHHYICARMPVEACTTAIAGAELAVRRGAPGEAERALSGLLRSYPQDAASRAHLVLANALVAEGEFVRAIETLGQWRPAAPTLRDAALAAHLRAEALHRGRLADTQSILHATISSVSAAEKARADLVLIRALQIRAEVAAEGGELRDAEAAADQAQRVAENSQSPECQALAALTRGYCLLVTGMHDAAASAFLTAAPTLRDLGLLAELRRVLNGLGMCWTCLDRLPEAWQSLREALVLARKLGDRFATCNAWNNIAALYVDRGLFAFARRSYEHAIALTGTSSTLRYAAYYYNNMATLSLECADLQACERYAGMADAAARETHLWRLQVPPLLTKADLHLAKGEPERAWPLVEEAVALTGNRPHVLDDAGQYARLRRHYVWSTGGYEAVARLTPEEELGGSYKNPADALQVRAFNEWMASCEGLDVEETGFDNLIRRRLFGVIARLMAVGVGFRNMPDPKRGESSAQLVVRAFQPEQRVELPPFDELLQSDVAAQRSA